MASTKRLLIATWFLNIYDASITIYATERLGLVEGNPVMHLLLATSVFLFLLVKLLVFHLVVRYFQRRHAARPRSTKWMTVGMFLSFFFVGIWNTFVVSVALTGR